jgi:hypothetical protein
MAYITLLSDFGLQDTSVAIAKGILMQQVPSATIIDITHEVQPFNKRQAAYLLGAAYPNFPEGTIHLALMDIFSAKNPLLVLSACAGQYFMGADNGLIPMALRDEKIESWQCLQLGKPQSFHDWLQQAGEIIEKLQNNTPQQLGFPPINLQHAAETKGSQPGTIDCDVIHIDTFGNVVLNCTRKQIAEASAAGGQFSLRFIQYEEIRDISANYTDVKEGFKLCRFNSNGYLEISINNGNAASLFGLKVGSKHNNAQITFR